MLTRIAFCFDVSRYGHGLLGIRRIVCEINPSFGLNFNIDE